MTELLRADLYEAFYGRAGEAHAVVLFHDALARRYGLGPSPELLEVGCGTGRLLPGIAALGWKVTALEPDEHYFDRARSSLRGLPVGIARGGFMELDAAGAYDFITAVNGPLFYLRTPAEQEEALGRVFSALRRSGVALVDVANFLHIMSHYGEGRAAVETRSVGGIDVTRTVRHDVDFANALWRHHDRYDYEGGAYEERFEFSIITAPELLAKFRRAGFEDVLTFEAWDRHEPAPPGGARIIVSGRKP